MTNEAGRGNSFRPGEAWRSPNGILYRVVMHDGEDITKPMQAVLRAGPYGDGRKICRDWEAVEGWTYVPEDAVHNESTRPPPDFEAERQRVLAYMDRSVDFDWISTRHRSLVPRDACCIVLCGKTAEYPADSRCLAYVKEKGGKLRWYGITSPLHEPAWLYGVVGFVPVADVAADIFA